MKTPRFSREQWLAIIALIKLLAELFKKGVL